MVVILPALPAKSDRGEDASLSCLHLAFEGEVTLVSGFESGEERPPLPDELVQFESERPTAVVAREIAALVEEFPQAVNARGRIDVGRLRQSGRRVGQGA